MLLNIWSDTGDSEVTYYTSHFGEAIKDFSDKINNKTDKISATSSDIGKALTVESVENGKIKSFDFVDATDYNNLDNKRLNHLMPYRKPSQPLYFFLFLPAHNFPVALIIYLMVGFVIEESE